jgi:hypothetical protein
MRRDMTAGYAILLGYGRFRRANTAYRRYVDNFASFVNRNRIDAVVLSGGRTDPKHPEVSEAGSMADYLRPLLKRKVRILLEERSLTTAQNIEFSKRFLNLKKDEVTVFCDNIRPQKVMWFILHYWFGLKKIRIERYFVDYGIRYYRRRYTTEEIGEEIAKGFDYKDVAVRPYRMHTRIEAAISQETATLLDVNALYDKSLRREMMRSTRIKFGMA